MQEEFPREPVRSSLYLKIVMEEKARYQIPDFWEVRRPEIHSILWRREISRIMELTNNDFKSGNLMLTSSLSTNAFVLEDNVQDGSVLLFKFPYGGHVVDQRSRDGYFSGRFKNLPDLLKGITPFPDLELLDARIAASLNKIIPNSYFKKKVSLEEQKVQKADRSATWSTTTSGHWRQRFCARWCRLILYCSSDWQYSGIRYTKFYYRWNSSYPMIFWDRIRILQHESSSWYAGILSNAKCEEISCWTTHSLAKSSWNGCPIVQEVSFGTRGHSLQKFGQDYSVTDYTCPVDAQGSDREKHTGNSEWQNSYGLSLG